MTLKEYKRERARLEYAVKINTAKISWAKEQAERCTSILSQTCGMNASKNIHATEDAMVELADAEQRFNEASTAMKKLDREFMRELDMLDDARHTAVIELRDIEHLEWSAIGEAMQYSERQVQRIYNSAVECLEKLSHNVARCSVDMGNRL